MREITTCPNCQRQLRLPDELLQRPVKCPECSHEFIIETNQSESQPSGSVDCVDEKQHLAVSTERQRHVVIDNRDESVDYENLPRRRRDLPPHRGSLILALGFCGLITGLFCGLGAIPSIIAIILANNDMQAIIDGRMDPDGEYQTRAGRTYGFAALMLIMVMFVVLVAYKMVFPF